jgi:hypothetical protein
MITTPLIIRHCANPDRSAGDAGIVQEVRAFLTLVKANKISTTELTNWLWPLDIEGDGVLATSIALIPVRRRAFVGRLLKLAEGPLADCAQLGPKVSKILYGKRRSMQPRLWSAPAVRWVECPHCHVSFQLGGSNGNSNPNSDDVSRQSSLPSDVERVDHEDGKPLGSVDGNPDTRPAADEPGSDTGA